MGRKSVETLANPTCLICETENPPEAMLCAECFAPTALGHDLEAKQPDPRIVSVIGESNVGKTVYLGFLLDMLAQRAGDFEAVPNGAYSVDLQQSVISHMAHRMFPPKTPMEADQWYWAHYRVRRNSSRSPWVDLVMPDMAGESLAAEIAAPRSFRVIRALLNKSGGLLLLVDAALAANGSTQPDFFAMKMLSYVDGLSTKRRSRRTKTPVALVLCKADHCPECFDDPQAFVRANLNRTWNLCESRFDHVGIFASSVVGSLGYATSPDGELVTPVPLHTALRGVLEPFEWMIGQL